MSSSNDPEITEIRDLISVCAQKAIHPIFAKAGWIDLSDEDYVRISPALVVASYMLTSPQATHFLAVVLGATRIPDGTYNSVKRYTNGYPMKRIDRSGLVPNDAQKALVHNTLDVMSKFLTKQFTEEPPKMGALALTRPTCYYYPGTEHQGMESEIEVMQQYLHQIDLSTPARWDLLGTWFEMAITLIHEVSHAVCIYKEGARVPEPAFENQGFYELGFALESFMFGGGMIHVKTECQVQGAMTLKGGELLTYAVPHPWDTRPGDKKNYIVGKAWLSQVFTLQFWNDNSGALGYLFPDRVFYSEMSANNRLTPRQNDQSILTLWYKSRGEKAPLWTN
jgi:hypothetical protein